MPRKARVDAPGALHHIIVRGIEKNPIFKDSQDYENFLLRLGTILTETATPCSKLAHRGRIDPLSRNIEATLFASIC
jgi:hypothetical protein